MSNPPELKVTSAGEWRKMREDGVIYPLPSGKNARLRAVGIEELVRRGRIPDNLTSLAAATIWKDAPSYEHVAALGKGAIEFLNIIVESAFLEPKVSSADELAEGEISIDDIELMDKQAVFQFVLGPTVALAYFRAQQAANVATVSNSDENGSKTKPSA